MTALSPSARHERAKIAAISRHRGATDPAVIDAQRNLRAAQLEDHIRRVVDAAPPLTDDQKDKLRALLGGDR